MPLRRDWGSMDDDALLRDDAQMSRIEHFMSEMNTEHFYELVEKARVLKETLGEESKATSSRAVKRMTGTYLVYGSMEHCGSDYSRRAIVVRDQPIVVIFVAPTSARGRGRGRGNGGRGAG
ncbi:hypothetical protein GOBAR_DD11967 [Gossypium barbadense]|nr:hypothetical protein GOBAR_DD11967 [Gossypium barbadense]